MRFPAPLRQGTLIQRYKRFLADVRLDDGRTVTAHSANTGSMLGCADPGQRVALLHTAGPKRKLEWEWELSRDPQTGAWSGVNTMRPNRIVEEALRERRLTPFKGFPSIRREVPYGLNNQSRIDLLLEGQTGLCFVEVKNVTLRGGKTGKTGMFPDAVSERGLKHLHELIEMTRLGHRAAMVYLVNRPDCNRLCPAHAIDPAYARGMAEATRAGVELYAWRTKPSLDGIGIERKIPVALDR